MAERMSKARQRRLTLGTMGRGADLTLDEVYIGYHWCPEWDELVISPNEPEWGDDPQTCCCGYPMPKSQRDVGRERSE